jgi:hypothetical protein
MEDESPNGAVGSGTPGKVDLRKRVDDVTGLLRRCR